jgi:cytidine deaminase
VVLTADGETFAGVNVGNDVGGICAEVAGLARALAVSTSRPELVAATRLDGVVTPCGRCRQLMIDRLLLGITTPTSRDRMPQTVRSVPDVLIRAVTCESDH